LSELKRSKTDLETQLKEKRESEGSFEDFTDFEGLESFKSSLLW
jgi:hypothetical protein